jgi:hypothetical protein
MAEARSLSEMWLERADYDLGDAARMLDDSKELAEWCKSSTTM